MTFAFEAAADGVHATLHPWAWRLRLYLADLQELLGPEPTVPDHPLDALAATLDEPPERPSDPVLARLLPDAVLDDPAASAEFRRFSQDTLLTRKRQDAATLAGLLDSTEPQTVLDGATARSVLGALNDLRLMLGTRLAITEEGPAEEVDDLVAYSTYDLLTALQYELVEVLTGDRGGGGETVAAP
jgi:hypothetical protein